MAKGYCEKKEGKDCKKCLRHSTYESQGLTCKHFVRNTRKFDGTLKDIKGIKMRRQWFFGVSVITFGVFVLFALLVIFLFDKNQLKSDLTLVVKLFLEIEVPLLILCLLNAKFFGKTVAVLTDNGIYTNQIFLEWDNIKEIIFYPHVIGREEDPSRYSFTKIVVHEKVYRIAHMPVLFLYKAKKYNPQIVIRFDKKITNKVLLIIGAVVITMLLIAIFGDKILG